jgi:hypothetical protein
MVKLVEVEVLTNLRYFIAPEYVKMALGMTYAGLRLYVRRISS